MPMIFYQIENHAAAVERSTLSATFGRITLSEAKQQLLGKRLGEFLENVIRELPVGYERSSILGFYNAEIPETMGILLYYPNDRNNNNISDIVLLTDWTNNPESEPYFRTAVPAWLCGFRVVACMVDPDHHKSSKMKRTREILLEAVNSVAVYFWKTNPEARKLNNSVLAQAYAWSSMRDKGAVLGFLRLHLYDPLGEDFISEKVVELADVIRRAARVPGRILFFVKKVDLCDIDVLKKVAQYHNVGGMTLVINYDSSILCTLLEQVVSLGCCAFVRMTPETPLKGILHCLDLKNRVVGVMTRGKKAALANRDLSWTLGYSYAEGHMTRKDYIAALVTVLKCTICIAKKKDRRHTSLHDRIILHKANLMSVEMKGANYPEDEVIWSDKTGKTLKTVYEEEILQNTYFFKRGLSLRQ